MPAAPRKVVLDCDPGIDDAFAIAFGCGHPGFDLRGVTTVAGNAGLDVTTRNALAVLEFLGRADVPVAAGCAAPLLRPSGRADGVHGESGLGGAILPEPRGRPVGSHAVDFLIEQARAAPGEVTLVATGPLTNVALAVRRHPPLVTQVADVVIMGGSAGRGNVTPAAEFNIACDPEAAAIVFGAGWRVTMAGLDVTLQARASAPVLERLGALGRLGTGLLLPGLAGYRSTATGDGQPVHDLCALALVAAPELFGCEPARVEVETLGRWTSGMTVTDFAAAAPPSVSSGPAAPPNVGSGPAAPHSVGSGPTAPHSVGSGPTAPHSVGSGPTAPPNALVAMSLDVAGFWELVLGALSRAAAAMGP